MKHFLIFAFLLFVDCLSSLQTFKNDQRKYIILDEFGYSCISVALYITLDGRLEFSLNSHNFETVGCDLSKISFVVLKSTGPNADFGSIDICDSAQWKNSKVFPIQGPMNKFFFLIL